MLAILTPQTVGLALIFLSLAVIRIMLAFPRLHSPAKPRKTESYIEERLYNALVREGFEVVPQYRIGRCHVDLAIPSAKLAIECDGKAYHSSPEQKAKDRRRDKFIRSRGWRVIRFTGREINGRLSEVVAKVESNL